MLTPDASRARAGLTYAEACAFFEVDASKPEHSVPCPVHDDGSPSCSIKRRDDGSVLAHCFACGSEPGFWTDFLAAVRDGEAVTREARPGSAKKKRPARKIDFDTVLSEHEYGGA